MVGLANQRLADGGSDGGGQSAITFAEMRVDAHVAGRAREALVFSVGDVLVGDGVDVLLGQSEICGHQPVDAVSKRTPSARRRRASKIIIKGTHRKPRRFTVEFFQTRPLLINSRVKSQ